LADANAVHISPDNRIEPDAAIILDDYVAHNGGVRGNEAIFPNFRISIFNG